MENYYLSILVDTWQEQSCWIIFWPEGRIGWTIPLNMIVYISELEKGILVTMFVWMLMEVERTVGWPCQKLGRCVGLHLRWRRDRWRRESGIRKDAKDALRIQPWNWTSKRDHEMVILNQPTFGHHGTLGELLGDFVGEFRQKFCHWASEETPNPPLDHWEFFRKLELSKIQETQGVVPTTCSVIHAVSV